MADRGSWSIEDIPDPPITQDQDENPGTSKNRVTNDTTAQLISTLMENLPIKQRTMKLPDFDPSKNNPKTWIRTSCLMMEDETPNRSQLARALTDSLKGTAAEWFAEIIDENLNWESFHDAFLAKFCQTDTPVAVIYQAINAQPRDNNTTKLISQQMTKYSVDEPAKNAD